MNTRWLTDDEQAAWRAWLRLLHTLPAAVERNLQRSSGLSGPDYHVLTSLSEAPGRRLPLKTLASSLDWSRSRVSHHLDRMAARGLVAREADPEDGRGCLATLTDHGWDALVAAAPDHVAAVRRLLVDRLTPAQLEALVAIADAVASEAASDCR